MSTKFLWGGLTLLTAGQVINLGIPAIAVVGAVIMVIGCILLVLDK